MSDEFLMVVPPGWTEIEDAWTMLNVTCGDIEMNSLISSGDFSTITVYLQEAGYIAEPTTVVAARLISTGDDNKPFIFWMRTSG